MNTNVKIYISSITSGFYLKDIKEYDYVKASYLKDVSELTVYLTNNNTLFFEGIEADNLVKIIKELESEYLTIQ